MGTRRVLSVIIARDPLDPGRVQAVTHDDARSANQAQPGTAEMAERVLHRLLPPRGALGTPAQGRCARRG
jgi:hypothetical protein